MSDTKNRLQNSIKDEFKTLKERYVSSLINSASIEVMVSLLPAEVEALIDDRDNCSYYVSSNFNEINITMPWNPLRWKAIDEALIAAGFVLKRHLDNRLQSWSKAEYYVYRHPLSNDVELNFTLSTTAKGAMCKRVPLKIVREVVERATEFEIVCPDQHPEMFNEQGEYVGDEVFPLIVDLTKPQEPAAE